MTLISCCMHLLCVTVYVMLRYSKAGKLGSNVRVSDVVQLLQKRKGENLYTQAKSVVDTLNHFMSSTDELITTRHVPDSRMDLSGKMKPIDHDVKMVKC